MRMVDLLFSGPWTQARSRVDAAVSAPYVVGAGGLPLKGTARRSPLLGEVAVTGA
ncbi:hypothetical protein GCM10010129_41000 [Streptomyces fumigatiscleroticus]|nr:hypothetical protein GCM10010129_41000 [Streptomyces fumigatiscleroticus]